MKIIKIELDIEGILTVYTDAFLNLGFNFNLDEIIDKNDLVLKLKQRIIEETNKIKGIASTKAKYLQLKSLEGTEF